MKTELTDAQTERFARILVLDLKGDPDQIVQPGSPTGYGTPGGECFAINPKAAVPLWRMYIPMARRLWQISRDFDAAPSPLTQGAELDQLTAEMAHLGVEQPKVA